MGCIISGRSVLKGSVDHQLSQGLSSRQVELVKHAWTVISQDMAGTGVVIFKHLFTQYPQLSRYFKKFMTLQEDGGYDWDLGGLERHALLVMQALEEAVDNLDDTQALSTILFELGRMHARHHVQEDMFDKMWQALKYGLEDALQDRMTHEMTQAWFLVYRFISRHVIEGMRSHYKTC
ncbi:neuroglobin-like [Tachypleus tridentatus]|uniref:neuroglobin-like n=1 Tax=Tachypleus tridentatus TaxID=6853 RepID=UPI003FD49BBC